MRKKQNFKVLLFLLLGVIIVSCVDDYEPKNDKIKNRETSNFKTTKITLKDVKQNSIAFSKLTNPKKDKSIGKINHKIINDTINNFSIDTEIGTFIESDNYHSYTFKVVRPNGSAFLLENLVVSKEGTNDYVTYLYQYDITEQELQMLKEGVQLNLTNKISILSIENTNIVTDLNAKEYPCFVQVTTFVAGTTCTGDGHHSYGDPICRKKGWDAATPGHYITESVLSSCSDGSGGFDNGDDGPYDPTETTGGGGTHTTITTPTFEPCETCEEFDENNPCEKIKNGTNSAEYKQKFKALTGNYNLDHETGFSKVGNNYVNSTNDLKSQTVYPSNSTNGTHVHNNIKDTVFDVTNNTQIIYDKATKIQSPSDLMILIRGMSINNNPTPENAFNIMLSDEGIYAITVIEAINTNDVAFMANFRKFITYYLSNAQKIINQFYSPEFRKKALQKMFLKGLEEMGLEDKVGFFEATIENENATDINNYKINWSRKKLNNNSPGGIEDAPCN
jgi:hypothetical protein